MIMTWWLCVLFTALVLPSDHTVHGQTASLVDILFGPDRGGSGSGNNGNSIATTNNNVNNQQPSGPIATLDTGTLQGLSGLARTSSSSSSSSSGLNSGTTRSSSGGLAGFGQLRPTARRRASCSAREKRVLFNSCAMSFGMAHMRHFDYLARRRTCDISVFDCGQVDSLIRCVNSQPVRVISNTCWPIVDTVLTGFLHQYRLPCNYADLKTKCEQTSADIVPIDQRQQQGRGMNTNPLSSIMPIIMRYAMPMIMMSMMGGGGLGALFAA